MRRRTKSVLAAVLVPGYEALRPDFDSSTVWVANGGSAQIGAANTGIQQLQDVKRVPRGSLRVVQDDQTVLLVDATNGTLRTVDPSTAELGPVVPVPPHADVQLHSGRVLVMDGATGDASLTTVEELAAGDALPDPVAQLGRGSVAVLSGEHIHAASPGLGRVIEIDIETGEILDSQAGSMSPRSPQLQMSRVGEEWVLYDSVSRTLSTSSWSTRLDFEGVRLQQPAEAGRGIVFASSDSLVRVVPGTSSAQPIVSGFTGTPSAPLLREGCIYAAWSGGAAWSDCADEGLLNLSGMSMGGQLELQARGASVVATVAATGQTWSMAGTGDPIDDWLIDDEPESEGEGVEERPPESEVIAQQEPPDAQDDQFGARAGVVTVLPVTRNDTDPNNDPLIITRVAGHDGATVSDSGQQIRLDLPMEQTDDVMLEYTVSDGQGGESTAAVAVELRAEDENAAPEQLLDTTAVSRTGGTITIDALADWVDPDGDTLTLLSVEAESPDAATARPDGRLELRDGGVGGVRRYAVVVSDGTERTEGTVTVSTTAQPDLDAQPVTAVARVGQSVELEPLLHVRGGEHEPRLHNVLLPENLEGEVSYEGGTVTVRPVEAGEISFPYVVTDGSVTRQSQIRVVVLDAETASAPPLPLPQAIALPPLGTTRLDLTASAADPSGGALTVTSVTSSHGALQASLADMSVVLLQLVAPLPEPATVEYTLSNGTAEAVGRITVSQGDPVSQAPIARDDIVRASPGQAVTVLPLRNDEHPGLAPVRLMPELLREPDDGVMFTDGDLITFLAPEASGTYEGEYEVESADGLRASARVIVQVGEAGRGTNQAPDAPNIDARVLAGQSVEISVPLAGTDPNGDPVQLLGQSSTASLGTLTRVDSTTFRYTAGDYSSGTDEISYLVADDRGEQSEGTLTIAVAPRGGVEARPQAAPDREAMRPGTSLAVDVLANDVDAASLPLSIASIELTRGDATAEIDGDVILVTAGEEEGDVGIVYTVENELGATSVAWLTVEVRADAEPPRPVGGDIDVPLTNILEASTATVDPLSVASVADGRSDLLSVEIAGGGGDARVLEDGSLEIPVLETAREIAYRVTRSDTGAAAHGIIRVPGTGDSLPQLRAGAGTIRVLSGETVIIDINDYIVAATGRPVWITDASTVLPTNSDGAPVVRDAQTLEFTSQTGYFGPANISMEVTDGDSPLDPEGRVGLVVLPIEVLPNEQVPPTVVGTTLAVEPGETRSLDLMRMTIDPAQQPEELVYSIREQPDAGITLSLTGSMLTMQVAPGVDVGAMRESVIGVSQDGVEGVEGILRFSVVSSTRPLVQPVTDEIDLRRGASEQVMPLSNDEATNPFPQPLVIDAVEAPGQSGVTAALGGDGRTVTVAASENAEIGVVTVRYRVLDATRDPARAVWGMLRVRLLDVPDRPEAPQQVIDRFVRGVLFVSVAPPEDNNSPLTRLSLTDQFGTVHECTLAGDCTVEGLEQGVDYRFTAVAENEVGASQASPLSQPMHLDALPNPVTGVVATPTAIPGQLRVQWQTATVPAGGTAVTGYLVRVSGPGVDETLEAPAAARAITVPELQPGQTYRISVAATNSANADEGLWRFSDPPLTATAVGRPGETEVIFDSYGPGTVSVRWASVERNGATGVRYRAQVIAAAEESSFTCSSNGDGTFRQGFQTGLTAQGLALPDRQQSVVAVIADNGWFCSVSFSSTRQGRPAAVLASDVEVRVQARSGAADPRLTEVPQLLPGHRLQVQLRSGTTTTGWQTPEDGWILLGSFPRGTPLDVYVRQVVRDGGTDIPGPATQAGAVVPFSLTAHLPGSCAAGDVYGVDLPENTVGAETELTMQVRVAEQWADHDPEQPLPLGSDRVRVKVSVAYDGRVYENPQWQMSADECL